MHKLRSFSVAMLAKVFSRLSSRLKSTGGRPSAPLGSRILTNPDDLFKHNMWSVMHCSKTLICHPPVQAFYGDSTALHIYSITGGAYFFKQH